MKTGAIAAVLLGAFFCAGMALGAEEVLTVRPVQIWAVVTLVACFTGLMILFRITRDKHR